MYDKTIKDCELQSKNFSRLWKQISGYFYRFALCFRFYANLFTDWWVYVIVDVSSDENKNFSFCVGSPSKSLSFTNYRKTQFVNLSDWRWKLLDIKWGITILEIGTFFCFRMKLFYRDSERCKLYGLSFIIEALVFLAVWKFQCILCNRESCFKLICEKWDNCFKTLVEDFHSRKHRKWFKADANDKSSRRCQHVCSWNKLRITSNDDWRGNKTLLSWGLSRNSSRALKLFELSLSYKIKMKSLSFLFIWVILFTKSANYSCKYRFDKRRKRNNS